MERFPEGDRIILSDLRGGFVFLGLAQCGDDNKKPIDELLESLNDVGKTYGTRSRELRVDNNTVVTWSVGQGRFDFLNDNARIVKVFEKRKIHPRNDYRWVGRTTNALASKKSRFWLVRIRCYSNDAVFTDSVLEHYLHVFPSVLQPGKYSGMPRHVCTHLRDLPVGWRTGTWHQFSATGKILLSKMERARVRSGNLGGIICGATYTYEARDQFHRIRVNMIPVPGEPHATRVLRVFEHIQPWPVDMQKDFLWWFKVESYDGHLVARIQHVGGHVFAGWVSDEHVILIRTTQDIVKQPEAMQALRRIITFYLRHFPSRLKAGDLPGTPTEAKRRKIDRMLDIVDAYSRTTPTPTPMLMYGFLSSYQSLCFHAWRNRREMYPHILRGHGKSEKELSKLTLGTIWKRREAIVRELRAWWKEHRPRTRIEWFRESVDWEIAYWTRRVKEARGNAALEARVVADYFGVARPSRTQTGLERIPHLWYRMSVYPELSPDPSREKASAVVAFRIDQDLLYMTGGFQPFAFLCAHVSRWQRFWKANRRRPMMEIYRQLATFHMRHFDSEHPRIRYESAAAMWYLLVNLGAPDRDIGKYYMDHFSFSNVTQSSSPFTRERPKEFEEWRQKARQAWRERHRLHGHSGLLRVLRMIESR